MDVLVQILCMLVSFVYGGLIRLFIKINNKILKTNKLWLEIIYKLIYAFIIVIGYIIIIYKINKGVFHVYFLLLMLLGYMLSKKLICKIKM